MFFLTGEHCTATTTTHPAPTALPQAMQEFYQCLFVPQNEMTCHLTMQAPPQAGREALHGQ